MKTDLYETQQLKFIDLFSGIGGFRTGMERAGNKCVGYCEIDKFARKSYQNIFNTDGEWDAKNIKDVTNQEWRELNDKYGQINAICGGFPCQSFSMAGKRRGFADKTRGTLFFEIARAAKEIKPQYLFLENVKGLLNHGNGETFRTILSTLDEIGYDVEWCVLNSKDFGVPQNRERIFIIGHLRGTGTREVFFKSREGGSTNETEVARPLKNLTVNGWHFEQNVFSVNSIASTLRAGGGSGNTPKIVYKEPSKIKYFYDARKNGEYGNKDVLDPSGISKTLETMTGGDRQPKVAIPVITPDRVNKRQRGRRFKKNNEPMYTLTAQDKHGVTTDNLRIRKLTPKECWRLQGFSDEAFAKAEEVVSNSQLYKQAGNSVTVPVIEWIAKRLIIDDIAIDSEEIA